MRVSLQALRKVLAVVAMVVAPFASGSAQSPNRPAVSDTQLEASLAELHRASQAGDRAAVAAMIRYPITISIAGFRVPFADAASLLARYDDIFTPALREAIARATVRPQAGRTEVTVTPEGYVIGAADLAITITAVSAELRITSISVPEAGDPSNTTIAPSVATSVDAAQTQEPRRIAIRVGPRPTQIPGLLARNATDTFVLYLPKGRLAGVRLERVPAGVAAIRVVHTRTGEPLGARPSADGRFVSGRPAESADYRIEVRRIGNADDAHVPYMLSLTLR